MPIDLKSLDPFDENAVTRLQADLMAAGKSPGAALQLALTQWAGHLRDAANAMRQRAPYADRQSQVQDELRQADALRGRSDRLARLAREVGQ
ncbi:MAG: hypothetical protein HQL47_10280 [Gammaproteobacteria bacterium]|nr:hypothetical protein [Gammaproteobacteria bacterium]